MDQPLPIVACVLAPPEVGKPKKYDWHWVRKLYSGVCRNMTVPFDFNVLCTKSMLPENDEILFPPIPGSLLREAALVDLHPFNWARGWWAKMALFDPSWRRWQEVLYLDLDTVILGDITPLATKPVEQVALCANFTRQINPAYNCVYGSCVIRIEADEATSVWERWQEHREYLIKYAGNLGDQKAIEWLVGQDAAPLQRLLPAGFFLHYRQFRETPDPNARLAIYAGTHRPGEYGPSWIRKQWSEFLQ